MRFVPSRRLKAVGQLAGTIPFLVLIFWQHTREMIPYSRVLLWLPARTEARWALGLALGFAAVAVVALGIRSLSADYLIRVSAMMQGSSSKGAQPGRSWIGDVVARLFGGQPARAGFVFVSRLARRDFQFLRLAATPALFGLLVLVQLTVYGWRTDPFSGQFTSMHLLPHILGGILFLFCDFLSYGSNFKSAGIFLQAPAGAFDGFARGVYAALCVLMVVIPHAIMLLLLTWIWGIWHAAAFVAYSTAVTLVYVALDLRRIDGVPFSKQVDPTRGANQMPLLIVGGLAIAIAVGLQYFFVFRSPAIVAAVTVVAGTAAYFLTRSSMDALGASISHSLALLSTEAGTLYREVDV